MLEIKGKINTAICYASVIEEEAIEQKYNQIEEERISSIVSESVIDDLSKSAKKTQNVKTQTKKSVAKKPAAKKSAAKKTTATKKTAAKKNTGKKTDK